MARCSKASEKPRQALILPSHNEIPLTDPHTRASRTRAGVLQQAMPRRKSPSAAMPINHPDQPATRLDLLRGHIKSCIATYDYHGVLAAEDLRRATARWPELRQLPTKSALRLA